MECFLILEHAQRGTSLSAGRRLSPGNTPVKPFKKRRLIYQSPVKSCGLGVPVSPGLPVGSPALPTQASQRRSGSSQAKHHTRSALASQGCRVCFAHPISKNHTLFLPILTLGTLQNMGLHTQYLWNAHPGVSFLAKPMHTRRSPRSASKSSMVSLKNALSKARYKTAFRSILSRSDKAFDAFTDLVGDMCKREIISFSKRSKTYPDLDGLNSITEFNWEDVLESTAQLKTVVAACRGGLSAKTDKRYQLK